MKSEESQGTPSSKPAGEIARTLEKWFGYVTAALYFVCASILYSAWVLVRSGPVETDPSRDVLLAACFTLGIGLVTACTISFRSDK